MAKVTAILLTRAKPTFVDVEEDTLLMKVNEIKTKITDKTKSILPVHLYGHPDDMVFLIKFLRNVVFL